MHRPEGFRLVAEPGVGVDSGEDVGQDPDPKVLSEETVGFQELAEPGEDGQDDVLPCQLVDGESAYRWAYMPTALTASAACWFSFSFYW